MIRYCVTNFTTGSDRCRYEIVPIELASIHAEVSLCISM